MLFTQLRHFCSILSAHVPFYNHHFVLINLWNPHLKKWRFCLQIGFVREDEKAKKYGNEGVSKCTCLLKTIKNNGIFWCLHSMHLFYLPPHPPDININFHLECELTVVMKIEERCNFTWQVFRLWCSSSSTLHATVLQIVVPFLFVGLKISSFSVLKKFEMVPTRWPSRRTTGVTSPPGPTVASTLRWTLLPSARARPSLWPSSTDRSLYSDATSVSSDSRLQPTPD